jgi:hypothetical protein
MTLALALAALGFALISIAAWLEEWEPVDTEGEKQ